MARWHAHPLRVTILEIFASQPEEEISSVRLSERLDYPLSNIAYHVKALRDAGMIEKSSVHARRGAIETRYKLA